ncbi:MAG: CapA family protein [Patescibacteria group bacterium]|nr:CapA family protein [Patescibacteria group bacterium]
MKKIVYPILFIIPLIGFLILSNNTIFSSKNQSVKTQESPKINQKSGIITDNKKGEKFFVPVSNFSYIEDNVTKDDLKMFFTEKQSGPQKYYILEENQNELKDYFQNNLLAQTIKNIDELVNIIKSGDIALIPFDKLVPQLKVLSLDGQNILDKDISNSNLVYPKIKDTKNNRDVSKINQIDITGVSAVSRTVQSVIDKKNDPIYPARAVMDELKKADITTIDSESSFFNGCPNVSGESLSLCGKPSSIEAFEAIGTDVVDLTGNHQSDFGSEKFSESIGYLESAGFEYFGGGKNKNDAAKILYKNLGNKKVAFLGYAYFDSLNGETYGTIATNNRSGVNFYSPEKVIHDINNAKTNADFVVLDYQFTETYSYLPLAEQIKVFHDAIDSGADIVIGIQAHQPQKIEFYKNKPIFYGLGNFFFDQMWSYPTRQGLIPQLTFYDGRLASIEILTTMLYDYSQPRFSYGEEREKLLKEVLPESIVNR